MTWRLALGFVAVVAYVLLRPSALPWVLLIGLIGAFLYFAYRSPPRVSLTRVLQTSRTFVGAPLEVQLSVRVRSWLPTLLTFSENVPLTLIADRVAGVTGLFWGVSEFEFVYRVSPNMRGSFEWKGSSLNWSDPLGLFVRDAKVLASEDSRLLVYPGMHALELPDLVRPLIADGPRARVWGLEDAMTLRGVRDYVPGDEARRVHWRQTARFGMDGNHFNRLVVRELERVAATGVQVHLDLSDSGRSGEVYLESAARLAASLLRQAFDAGLRVSVSSLTAATVSGTGFSALENALTFLAQVRLEPDATVRVPLPAPGANLVVVARRASTALIEGCIHARARAARVTLILLPEGFYLEPGEKARPMFSSAGEDIRDLERRAGILEEAGVRAIVLRGDDSVLKLSL
jgi:uncharacterized protein (DUF58 family)